MVALLSERFLQPNLGAKCRSAKDAETVGRALVDGGIVCVLHNKWDAKALVHKAMHAPPLPQTTQPSVPQYIHCPKALCQVDTRDLK